MELGYTLPLQKQLNVELLPSKPPIAPFFCWAVHILTVQGRKAVLAMNRDTRYSSLLYGMRAADWVHLPGLVQNEIKAAILREGLSEYEAVRYFTLSGPLKISTVRKSDLVTGLNWTMQTLLRHAPLLDESRFSQPQVTCLMNCEGYYAPGFSKSGTPREFFLAGFRCL